MKMANARAVCKLAKPPGNKTVRDFRLSSFGYWQSASIIKCFTEKKEKTVRLRLWIAISYLELAYPSLLSCLSWTPALSINSNELPVFDDGDIVVVRDNSDL